MPILYDAGAQTLTIHTLRTTWQMKVMHHGILVHTYYGPRCEGDMSYALQYLDRGFSGNPFDAGMDRTVSCDALPQEYPCEGSGDYRRTAFGVRDAQGVSGCDLRYAGHRILPGKYSLPGMPAVYADDEEAQTLEVTLRDERLSLEVKLLYGVLPAHDCITRTAVVTNRGGAVLTLENAASTCVDVVRTDLDRIVFHGKHTMERQPERTPVSHGELLLGSRRGTSSHHMNPFTVLCEHEATEQSGLALGVGLLWSGSFSGSIGADTYGATRLLLGIQNERFNYELRPGECFTAPEALMVLSAEGLTGMSQRLHDVVRKHIVRGPWRDAERPILINNWEATYMNFTGEKLLSIARRAKELGVEMMVLDDGWFGRRNDDHDGLGDWTVNEAKLGCSMKELAKKIQDMGLRFGLWIEPEMVNMASDLYREHPDWAYVIPGKPPVRSRDQLLLDFSREEVVDSIYSRINAVISGCGIDYIKMDMNRSVHDVYTVTRGLQSQGKVLYRYVLGVYDFMQRLLDANPELLIEGCSGGGGRFDLGMLYYTPQIWTSDNTDPIERLRIQYGTSFCYPVCAMGAHVSVSPNEATGRVTPLSVRGAVAMAGTFGYELDLNLLPDAEKEEVRRQIVTFRGLRRLTLEGDYYRLTDCVTDRDASAWMIVSKDRSEALLTWVTRDVHDNMAVLPIRARGLDPEAVYEDEATGESWTGAALMYQGVIIPRHRGEYSVRQYHLLRR